MTHPALPLVEELAGLPLLGPSRERALLLHREVSDLLVDHPHPALLRRVKVHFGEVLAASGATGRAVPLLLDAARRCAGQGDPALALYARLQAVPLLCDLGRRDSALELLEGQGECVEFGLRIQALACLARAAVCPSDEERLLIASIRLLPAAAAHHRLRALLRLGDCVETGHDPGRAGDYLAQALELARQHDDAWHVGRTALILGGLLLRRGLPDEALETLRTGVDAAMRAGDGLAALATFSILNGLHLDRKDILAVQAMAPLQGRLALERGNPAGLADAAISLAAAHLLEGRPDAADGVLLDAAHKLAAMGDRHAIHLVKARLAEIRLGLCK